METLADGRFEVRRKLGEGGFGAVYAAYDRVRHSEVALKLLSRADPQALFRFKQEFRSLADVRHPNLVELQELFVEGDQWFFTMELVAGSRFSDWVRLQAVAPPASDEDETTKLPSLELLMDFDEVPRSLLPERVDSAACDMLRLRRALPQLVGGVRALHAAGKLHCDLKPSNVMVTPAGRVVLLDFGLVREITAEMESERQLVGTPSYMSPEQASAEQLSEASDWYSVGVMLFEALTGQLPFFGSMDLVLAAKRHISAPAPSEVAAQIPPDLDQLCVDLLRLTPSARPKGSDLQTRFGVEASAVKEAYVGQERELAKLRALPKRVLIEGDLRSGRSTLVRRFLDSLDDVTVLAARCYAQETVPYKGIDGLIDALMRRLVNRPQEEQRAILRDDGPLLARLFPVLARLPVCRGDAPGSGYGMRERAAKALKGAIERLALERPVIIVVDDAHFGDADGAALLHEIVSDPMPERLTIVLVSRLEDHGDLVRALDPTEVITLKGFDDESGEALVERLLGHREPSIVREARGDPWLIRTLCSEGLSDTGKLLSRRLAQTEPEAKRLLELVACAGRPIDGGLLLRAADMPQGTVHLSELCVNGLVRARSTRGATVVEAVHDRIRDGVLERMPAYAKRFQHACIAEQLQAESNVRAETLAVHWYSAGDYKRAHHWFERAANDALHVFAFERAARLLRRAQALEPHDRGGRAEKVL